MRKILYSLVVVCFPVIVFAQAPFVSITGTACVASTLTVNSSIQPYKILWKRNFNAIDSAFAIWSTGGATVAGQYNGVAGQALNYLYSPLGISVDGSGNVYVADAFNDRVVKWAPGASYATMVAGTGFAGNGANQLSYPSSVFVDASGNIYVADLQNNRVQKWGPGATSGTMVAGNGTAGNSLAQLDHPTAVFVDGSGNVYVCDQLNHRVQKWAPNATSGTTVAGNGSAGSGPNQLNFPYGVCLDAGGNIYVSDYGNERVQKWAPNATIGITVAGRTGIAGNADSLLNSPKGIFVDGNGNIYISDLSNNRIQSWQPGATQGITIAGGNGSGYNVNQFNQPVGVFVDNKGNLFVADQNNNRVQQFAPAIVNTLVPLSAGNYTATVTTFTGATNTTATYPVSDTMRPKLVVTVLPGSSICAGDTIHFNAIAINSGSSPGFQWLKNDTIISGATSASFSSTTLANGDYINCVLTPSTACPTLITDTSITDTITVNPVVSPSISVTNNTGISICSGQSVVFSAFAINTGNAPQYQWKVNGINILLPLDSTTYTTDTLHDNDFVSCNLYSNAVCATTSTVQSAPIIMHVDSVVIPSIMINVFPGDTVCLNDSVFFSAQAHNVGQNAIYQWYDNNYAIPGATGITYSNPAYLDSGHIFLCYVTPSLNCVSSPIAGSNEIEIITTGLVQFSVNITATTTHLTQFGQTVKFTATNINGGANVSYQWRKNSINIPGAIYDTLVDNTLENNDAIDCIATTASACVFASSVVSNLLVISSPLDIRGATNLFTNFYIFPNPNKGVFTIQGKVVSGSNIEDADVELLDMVGKVILNESLEIKNGILNKRIKLSNITSNGIYILRIKTKSGNRINQVIVTR